jgi:hypothetical protein
MSNADASNWHRHEIFSLSQIRAFLDPSFLLWVHFAYILKIRYVVRLHESCAVAHGIDFEFEYLSDFDRLRYSKYLKAV